MHRARLVLLLAALSATSCADATSSVPLALLVTVDTLRADRLGAYGSERGITASLDALAEESLVFERAYAPAPFTLPSVASLLTGRYPEELGILSNRSALAAEIPTVATALRARGWCTRAVVSNFVLKANAGLARGFEVYDDDLTQRERTRKWPERIAGDTTRAALRQIDALPEAPCFVWIHYQDPHGPYTPPEGRRASHLARERDAPDGRRRLPARTGPGWGALPTYQEIDGEREVAFYRAGYDAEIAYADEEIGRLFAGLRERGLYDTALIVFTADHGESLGEGDYWFAHGDTLSEALVRVPLLVRDPATTPGRRTDLVSLVDLNHTLLRRLGAAPASSVLPGRDLLRDDAPSRDSVPYLSTLGVSTAPRYGLVDGDHKLVIGGDGDGDDALFGVWDESVPLDAPDEASRLRGRLDAFRAQLDRRPPLPRPRLGDADREALRALGYLDSRDATDEP